MAFEDELRDFMENRLTAFDPSIDLSANSTAQVQIIEPLVARFGEDPFAIDIPTFLRERLVQEFPDLAADKIKCYYTGQVINVNPEIIVRELM